MEDNGSYKYAINLTDFVRDEGNNQINPIKNKFEAYSIEMTIPFDDYDDDDYAGKRKERNKLLLISFSIYSTFLPLQIEKNPCNGKRISDMMKISHLT